MKKKTMKRYHKDILSKDFTISFMAGLGGGATFWFFTLIIPELLAKNYSFVAIAFLLYILVGIISWLFLRGILLWMYGKK